MRSDLRLSRAPAWLAAGLLCLALPAAAQQVYQWKDANGVTHYTDTPPPGQSKPTVRTGGGKAPAQAAAAPKPVANADCTNARSNLNVLQGKDRVFMDENKDGKPDRELNAGERATRLKQAEHEVELYCEQPAANAVTTKKS